ncbi:MAG: hypothetical protein JXA52_03310 [Planctomycetes bacterium]|nr:hypothetical protein [Planctomycetota bacterium]
MLIKRSMGIATAILMLLASGCVVQSINPYCTDESVIEPPADLLGEWQPVIPDEAQATTPPQKSWTFEKQKILTYGENDIPAWLDSWYFKIDGQLYLDTRASEPDEKQMNGWYFFHVTPVHVLSKVELKGDMLEISPLSYDWMKQAVQDNKIVVTHVEKESRPNLEESFILSAIKFQGDYLFTASPQEWEAFLEKYAEEPGVFPSQETGEIHLKFKKVVKEEPKDQENVETPFLELDKTDNPE